MDIFPNSDKWIQQGNIYTAGATSGTITLKKTMKNTNYTIVATDATNGTSTDTDGVDFTQLISNVTTTTFRFSNASGRHFFWLVSGYMA